MAKKGSIFIIGNGLQEGISVPFRIKEKGKGLSVLTEKQAKSVCEEFNKWFMKSWNKANG